jgi:hypothetical protein
MVINGGLKERGWDFYLLTDVEINNLGMANVRGTAFVSITLK